MKVYFESNGDGKIIEDPFHSACLVGACQHDNYCVVSVLNNRVIMLTLPIKRQVDLPLSEHVINESLKQICGDDKEEGGQGVSLSDTTFANNLSAWDTIKKYRGFPTGEYVFDRR